MNARITIACTIAACLGPLIAPRPAFSFCRTLTGEPANLKAEAGCPGRGVPIYWQSRCVGYSIERRASRKVSYDLTAQILSNAFAKWGQSTCPVAEGPSRVSIDVRDLGEVACGKVGYDEKGENQNVIIFQEDEWPYKTKGAVAGDSSTLGMTTVRFNTKTGAILDADMEINTFNFANVSTDEIVAANGYDLRSIVMHEAGHFLGLAHSIDKNATMYASYDPGELKKRYPKLDDVLGLCAAYPPEGTRPSGNLKTPAGTSCDPLPRRGVDRACAPPANCGFAAADVPSGSVALLLALLGRRRRPLRTVATSR